MTTDAPFTPTLERVRDRFIHSSELTGSTIGGHKEYGEAFDRFLAKERAQARAAGVREIAEQIERQEEIGPLRDSQLSDEQRKWWERNTADGMFWGDDFEEGVRWLRARADRIEGEA